VNAFQDGIVTLVGSTGIGDVFVHGLQGSPAIQFVCVCRGRLTCLCVCDYDSQVNCELLISLLLPLGLRGSCCGGPICFLPGCEMVV
jgi:hypothetical protein